MVSISAIKSDIASKINTATGLTASTWAGEEKALSASRPALYVQYRGGMAGENEEIGGKSYLSSTVFMVLVATEDIPAAGMVPASYGDVQAAAYLDQIRDALNDAEVSTFGWLKPWSGAFPGGLTESLIDVHAGVYLYGQGWIVEQLVT